MVRRIADKGQVAEALRFGKPAIWNPGSWIRRKPVFSEQSEKTRDTDRCSTYIHLKIQHDGFAWFEGRGSSMLSVFTPMERVKVVPLKGEIVVGQVVVFTKGTQLTAHRVIGWVNGKDRWVTKGDTLAHFDKPLRSEDILGAVETVSGWRGTRKLQPDRNAACLSSLLAEALCGHAEQRPAPLKLYGYLFAFMILFPFRHGKIVSRLLDSLGKPGRQHGDAG